MSKDEVIKVWLKAHDLWTDTNGKRGAQFVARGDSLRGADLDRVNLQGADLRGPI